MILYIRSIGNLLIVVLASLLFRKTNAEWSETETAQLFHPNGGIGSYFGGAVAMHNGVLVVGAKGDTEYEVTGSVVIFEVVDDGWSAHASLSANDEDTIDFFGYAVAIHDGMVAVGAPREERYTGAVYIYGKEIDGSWTEKQKLLPNDAPRNARFGTSLSMIDDTLLVGATEESGFDAGSIYVYGFLADSWTQESKLTPSDGMAYDQFGGDTAMSGDMLVTGATSLLSSIGSAYLFRRESGLWTECAKLTPHDRVVGDRFGRAVAIDGGSVCVGSQNGVYVFAEVSGAWTQQAKLAASDIEASDFFGFSLALQNGVLAVGDIRAEGYDYSSGAVYMFEASTGLWTQEAKLIAEFGLYWDHFGIGIAIDDGVVAAGASGYVVSRGSVYTFESSTVERPSIMPSVSLTSNTPSLRPSSQTEEPGVGPSPVRPILRLFCAVFFFFCRDE